MGYYVSNSYLHIHKVMMASPHPVSKWPGHKKEKGVEAKRGAKRKLHVVQQGLRFDI